jgi:arylsulfatase A-like enzyme
MRNTHGYQSVELEEAWYTKIEGSGKCDYTRWFEENLPGEDINASGLHYTDHRGGIAFPFEEKYHATHWTADRAIHFLENYKGEKPWLLKVSFQRPHPPFDPPERWLDQYRDTDIPKAKVGNWATEKYGQKTGLLSELKNPTSGNFPEEEIDASRRAYYAAISFVDEQLGRVLEALEERGELENTLIIYTADHGDMMGDHHMWRKCRAYDGSARIPMILRWPESMPLNAGRGQVRDELVELRDVLPTFLDAAGMVQPPNMDGASMFRILRNESWREILDLEHAQIYEKDNAWTALTDGRYKYIYFTLTGQQQLFDLEKDPHEMVNLASKSLVVKNDKLVEKWRGKMIEYLKIRGEAWVKDGDLVVQEKPIYFGANHPKFTEFQKQ